MTPFAWVVVIVLFAVCAAVWLLLVDSLQRERAKVARLEKQISGVLSDILASVKFEPSAGLDISAAISAYSDAITGPRSYGDRIFSDLRRANAQAMATFEKGGLDERLSDALHDAPGLYVTELSAEQTAGDRAEAVQVEDPNAVRSDRNYLSNPDFSIGHVTIEHIALARKFADKCLEGREAYNRYGGGPICDRIAKERDELQAELDRMNAEGPGA